MNQEKQKAMQESREDWKQRKQQERKDLLQMMDDAAKEVVASPGALKSFLDTQARMERYSSSNALLIHKQFPEARELRDFDDWAERKMGIRKGEKGISILEPAEYTKEDGTAGISYHVKKVFDISQTSSNQERDRNRTPVLSRIISSLITTSPVSVVPADQMPIPEKMAYYDSQQMVLYVRRDLGNDFRLFEDLAKEISHAEMAVKDDRYNRMDADFTASCAGYMLCRRFGVETRALDMQEVPAKLREKEPKEIREVLSGMRNTMHAVSSRVRQDLYRKSQERSQEQER